MRLVNRSAAALRSWGWLVLPSVAGTVLRLWNLPAQILGGDEIYGVRAALTVPLGEVLTTYQVNDDCLPLAGLYRFLLDRGVALTELIVRAPVLLCGLAALLLIPIWTARRLGRAAGHLAAWLVALSPILVFYSRIARPYLPIVLLGFSAAASFYGWWRTGRRGFAVAYAICAALSAYFHLGSAPFVLAPLAFAAGARLAVRPAERPGWIALSTVAAATAGLVLAFLVPAWPSLHALAASKRAPLLIEPITVRGVSELMAGSAHPAAVLLFWLAAAVGLARLFAVDRELGSYTAVLSACQVAGLLVLSPEMLVHPLVFDRYLIPALPFVLLWVAAGLRPPDVLSPLRRRLGGLVSALAIAALFLTGPLLRPALRTSPFAQHNDYVGFFCPPGRIPARAVPEVYRTLLAQDPGAPILEFPWSHWWADSQAYYVYQEIHGQDVLVALAKPLPDQERLHFRNMPPSTPEGFLASRARYLVLHSDMPAEEDLVDPHCLRVVPEPMLPLHRAALLHAAHKMVRVLLADWGEPDLESPHVLVWDLDRVRRTHPPAR